MDPLTAYISKARNAGAADDAIQKELVSSGWDEAKVIATLHGEAKLPPPPPPPSDKIVSEGTRAGVPASNWIAFEHILLFISLYVLATALAIMMHFLADKWFPGVTSVSTYTSYNDFSHTLLRGCLAAAIVSLPIFTYFFLSTAKQMFDYPQLRQINARKSLIYGTLVVTFIIMISQIIRTVYAFLNGNVTTNFFIHLLITLFVCGIIFGFYLSQVQEDRRAHA